MAFAHQRAAYSGLLTNHLDTHCARLNAGMAQHCTQLLLDTFVDICESSVHCSSVQSASR